MKCENILKYIVFNICYAFLFLFCGIFITYMTLPIEYGQLVEAKCRLIPYQKVPHNKLKINVFSTNDEMNNPFNKTFDVYYTNQEKYYHDLGILKYALNTTKDGYTACEYYYKDRNLKIFLDYGETSYFWRHYYPIFLILGFVLLGCIMANIDFFIRYKRYKFLQNQISINNNNNMDLEMQGSSDSESSHYYIPPPIRTGTPGLPTDSGSSSHGGQEYDECIFCFRSLNPKRKKIIQTYCPTKTRIHELCFMKWIQKNDSCPCGCGNLAIDNNNGGGIDNNSSNLVNQASPGPIVPELSDEGSYDGVDRPSDIVMDINNYENDSASSNSYDEVEQNSENAVAEAVEKINQIESDYELAQRLALEN